jgi:hypothetical protein
MTPKPNRFKIITPENTLKILSNSECTYFLTNHNGGLLEIENGKSKLVSDAPFIAKSNKIVNVFSLIE